MNSNRNRSILRILSVSHEYVSLLATVKRRELTRIGALLRRHEKGVNLTSTLSRPFSLYAVVLDCRGPYLYQWPKFVNPVTQQDKRLDEHSASDLRPLCFNVR